MQYLKVIIHTNHTSLSFAQWGQGRWSESKAATCSGYRLLKKTGSTLRRECSRWFLLGTILRVCWTMAAMTSTVGGVPACILHPMMRSSQSDFVCALQKTQGSAVIFKRWPARRCIPGCGLAVPLRWQKGNACQGAASTSLCPGNFYWSRPLTLFSAVVECNHWEVDGFSTEDGAERVPPERLTMSPHRTLKDWDIWAKLKTGFFSAQEIKVEKKP